MLDDIYPIKNHILFAFEDEIVISNNTRMFRETLDWGLPSGLKFQLVTNPDRSVKLARWGVVLRSGPEAIKDFPPGVRILIEPLKWTLMAEWNGQRFWRTDVDQILAVDADSYPTTENAIP